MRVALQAACIPLPCKAEAGEETQVVGRGTAVRLVAYSVTVV